jgi:hypothetical protein
MKIPTIWEWIVASFLLTSLLEMVAAAIRYRP